MKGFTTIHAGSARQALTRLRFLAQLSDTRSELPLPALNALVSEAIDVVVHCDRRHGEVKVTEVVAVEDQQASPDSAAFTITHLFRRERWEAPLRWTGEVPIRAAPALEDAGYDPRVLLEAALPARTSAPESFRPFAEVRR